MNKEIPHTLIHITFKKNCFVDILSYLFYEVGADNARTNAPFKKNILIFQKFKLKLIYQTVISARITHTCLPLPVMSVKLGKV